jgi:hypothetical protein
VALEEFGHLIPNETTNYVLKSLYNATVGDTYRVGGVDSDNLYPAYSNPVSFQIPMHRIQLTSQLVDHARICFWVDWAASE